ncbi:sigma-70 family RNA polymerase sigma factor [Persicimonas caeni]|uniref:Sigma-70 family RNA polymerase sigma factor n=1 Tax=Persicimonas caeni TaxID=2292766 RepID=A0A4Y6PPQ5_PERCE|nr:sigma-70 family RNA polymerase sigma factor [Persicimonas caeni]QDG50294.1 sigma-70 family RNA polymerase sigma factor [Persicimonas caeni]QED31515.1 sigma-70 family RNA polymerase sigma factor [Persicimonas caeni]
MELQALGRLERSRVTFCPECSDRELVDRTNAGSWAAFEELVDRYQDQFHRLAWSYMKNEADAQDVVQVAFLKIYRNLEGFRGDAKFKNWAYRIVVNTALSRIRKERRRREVALDDVSPDFDERDEAPITLADWRVRADEALENRELRQKIVEAVDELEPKYQSIFLLYEVEGLSLDEIGEVVGLTVPGVKSRLHRARLFLRATLERYLRDMGPELTNLGRE